MRPLGQSRVQSSGVCLGGFFIRCPSRFQSPLHSSCFTGNPKPHLLVVEMHLHAAHLPSSMCTLVPSRRGAEIRRCITWALTISWISLPMRLAAGMYINMYSHNMISSLLLTLSHDHA